MNFRPRLPDEFRSQEFELIRQKLIELGLSEALHRLDSDYAEDKLYHRIKTDLKGKSYTRGELLTKYGITLDVLENVLSTLKLRGYNLVDNGGKLTITPVLDVSNEKLNLIQNNAREVRFGVVSDNHLCSKYARLDVLNSLYDMFVEAGVSSVYNTGNWIDGESKVNKYDLIVYGIDAQLEYFLNHYPKRNGITTYFITGDDHEGWYTQREGVNIGRYMHMLARSEFNRDDLYYIGHMESDVYFTVDNDSLIPDKNKKACIMRLMHPGGGSSYAFSYAPQKIVESFQGGEKPNILLIGHYHKASYDYIRDVHVIQAGCTQDQTPFMRKNKIAAHIGGWIVELSLDDDCNIRYLKTQWIPFFDRNFYEKKWSYR